MTAAMKVPTPPRTLATMVIMFVVVSLPLPLPLAASVFVDVVEGADAEVGIELGLVSVATAVCQNRLVPQLNSDEAPSLKMYVPKAGRADSLGLC